MKYRIYMALWIVCALSFLGTFGYSVWGAQREKSCLKETEHRLQEILDTRKPGAHVIECREGPKGTTTFCSFQAPGNDGGAPEVFSVRGPRRCDE